MCCCVQVLRFSVQRRGEPTGDAKDYEAVKSALPKEFEVEQDVQHVIEKALALKFSRIEDIMQVLDKARKSYDNAKFTEEQKFVLLPKAAFTADKVRSFTVLHARKTFKYLRLPLQYYYAAWKRFRCF